MHMLANALNLLNRFANKTYRDGYMQSRVRMGIAYQIQALRQKFGLTQLEFGNRIGAKQSVVSRLENTEYGKVSIQTLLDVASALNVALLVRFVSYPEFLLRTADMSPEALTVDTIDESLAAAVASRSSITIVKPSNSGSFTRTVSFQRLVPKALNAAVSQ